MEAKTNKVVVVPKKGIVTFYGKKTEVNYNKLASQIDYDLGHGVYDNFPVVKEEMQRIHGKLTKLIYVTNAVALNNGNIQLLKDNDYIRF